MKRDYILGIFLGALLAIGLVGTINFFTPPANADAGFAGGGMMAVNGNVNAQKQDLLYIMDPGSKRIAVYGVDLRGTFNLLDVRNFKYDLQLDFFSTRQKPTVVEIMKQVK